MLDENLEKIRGIELFEGVDVDALQKIIESGQFKNYKNGDIIFEEGDTTANSFYLIISGTVAIVKNMRKKEETVSVLSKGNYFGEFALFSEYDRQAKPEVRENTELLEISKKTIDQLKENHPQAVIKLYENMFEQVAKRFREMAQKAEKSQFWF